MDLSHDDSPEAELPSCSGCRKRKLRCSRQRPACSNCERLGAPCIYENRRTKPGLKGGAVESLNQRLEKVERALFSSENDEGTQDSDEGLKRDTSGGRASRSSSTPLVAVLSTLAGELQKLNENIEPTRKRKYEYDPYRKVSELLKRRRRDEVEEQHQSSIEDVTKQQTHRASSCRINIIQDHLDKLIEAHFDNIQPWIPMIIMRGFHDRLQKETDQRMNIVLEAMMIASLRYVEINDNPLDNVFIDSETSRLRQRVMMDAMEGLKTENLQALIMIAFTE
ncbi:fungal specific transcription factor factor, partial [Fusarium pseudoanthophilum]